MEKRRPAGLGANPKSKKPKPDDEKSAVVAQCDSNNDTGLTGETNTTSTINTHEKGLYFELGEEATQLDELKAMLEMAESTIDDPEKAIPLLRGVIHECDLMGRSGDGMVEDVHYWIVYGDALLALGRVEFKDDAAQVSEFVREAVDRYQKAVEIDNKSSLALKRLIIAKCMLLAVDEDEKCLEIKEMVKLLKNVDIDDEFIGEIVETAEEAISNRRMFMILYNFRNLVKPILESDKKTLSKNVLRFVNLYTESTLEKVVANDEGIYTNRYFETYYLLVQCWLEEAAEKVSDLKDADNEYKLLVGEMFMLYGSVLEVSKDQMRSEFEYGRARRIFEGLKSDGFKLPEGVLSFLREDSNDDDEK